MNDPLPGRHRTLLDSCAEFDDLVDWDKLPAAYEIAWNRVRRNAGIEPKARELPDPRRRRIHRYHWEAILFTLAIVGFCLWSLWTSPAVGAERISARLVPTIAAADVVYAYSGEGPRLFVSSSCVGQGYPRLRVNLISDKYDSRAVRVQSARSAGDADIILCTR